MLKKIFVVFAGLFGAASPTISQDEQAVVVRFEYGLPDMSDLFMLESSMRLSIESANVGMHDGNEVAVDMSHGFLYSYGPDAEKLAEVLLPIFEATPFMKGAVVRIRCGPPEDGVTERVVVVGQ